MAITLSTDGYCEASDVAARLQSLTIDANSDPSTTEVEGFITQHFAEIGGMLVAAGYIHPVSQAAGSLTSTGSIVTKDAAEEGANWLTFQASGGTLSGTVRPGDFFRVGSDAQRYMVTFSAGVDGNGEIGVAFSPDLELDAAAGATVTFTSASGAPAVLKRLNALGASVMTVEAAYGPDADDSILGPLQAERDRLFKAVQTGTIVLLGADRINTARTIGSARLRRV